MSNNNNSAAGVIAGASTGLYEGISTIFADPAIISWAVVFETAILALVGGALGWIGAELIRWVVKFGRKIISKRKCSKNDKNCK